MNNVITILTGSVTRDNWAPLTEGYEEITKHEPPPKPIQSYLAQDTKDKTRWCIISVWKDAATLQEMRSSGATPAGIRLFRSVSSEPVLEIFEVLSQIADRP